MVGPLMNIWRSQCKVSPNLKGVLWGLLLWYAPSYWWHRVTCLLNIHDTWWMRRSLDPPPHHTKIFPYNHQPPHPTPLPCIWPILPDYNGGGSIRAISEDLASWPGRRRTVRGIVVHWFSRFCGVWSILCCIIINILFLWMKPEIFLPRCLYSWRTWWENASVWRTCST